MKFIYPIYLISKEYKPSKISDEGTGEENKRKVLADKSSVRQSEHYQAQASGVSTLKPEIVFLVRSFEYKGETLLLYENKKYKIMRTYNKEDGVTELICTSRIGDRNGQV